MKSAVFTLRPKEQFSLELTVWLMRRVPINEIDNWDGQSYRRVLVVEGKPIEVSVTQAGKILKVLLSGNHIGLRDKLIISQMLKKMLGLETDLNDFYRIAGTYKKLSHIVRQFKGFRPPRMP